MTAPVVVVGDVMDDVSVRLGGPIRHATDTEARISLRGGGGGANQAAWLGSLGVPVRLVARVGAADVDRHAAALGAFGVEASLAGDAERETGRVVLLVDEAGERTMLTDPGANAALEPADLPEEAIAAAQLLVVSGYTLLRDASRAAGVRALQVARDAGVPVAIDPASVGLLADAGHERLMDDLRGAWLVLPTAQEAAALTGEADPERALRVLCGVAGVVALKLGAEGALVGRGAERFHALAPPLPPGADLTGAGDAFAAGLIAALLGGAGLADAAAAGVRTAAVAVGVVGGRPLT